MRIDYAIRTPCGLLYGFFPNGLPVGKKREYVKKYGKFFPIFRPSEIFIQSGGYITFKTGDEANDYLSYIRREIQENAARYDEARPESSEKLLAYAAKFKIIERRS